MCLGANSIEDKSLLKRSVRGALAMACVLGFLAGCTTTTMSEAERDALMAECQLINDDNERRACLERLALGDQVDPAPPQNYPVNL